MKDQAWRILMVVMLVILMVTVYVGISYGFLAGLISCFVVGVLAYIWLYIRFCYQTEVRDDE